MNVFSEDSVITSIFAPGSVLSGGSIKKHGKQPAERIHLHSAGSTTLDAEGRTCVYDVENKQVEVKDSLNATVG